MPRTSPSFPLVATLALLVVGSLLALGAVHTISLFAVCALSSIAAVMTLRSRIAGGRIFPAPYGILLALAAYSCLQALPLPLDWLDALSPASADIWRRSLLPLNETPRFSSLSLDPGASLVEALKWLTYANVFLLAACLARHKGAYFGAAIVFGTAALAGLVTLLHGLAGATSVYGFYQPRVQVVPWHVGPLLNPNNLAGLLNLGTFCGLGLLLKSSDRAPIPRWALALGISLTVGMSASTASRGGIIALVLGLFAFAILVTWKRPRHRRVGLGALLLAVGGGLALAILGAQSDTWQELLSKDLEKLKMALWVKPIVNDHPFFGIGRGAFESVFPAYRPPGGNVVYTHAESFVLQWIVEWGLPVALFALVALSWALVPKRESKRRSSLSLGIGVGLFVLLLQNLADLALEVPAIGIAVATLLGTTWGRNRKGSQDALAKSPPLLARRAWQAATVLAPAALILWLLASGFRDVATDRARVHELLQTQDAKAAELAREALASAMRRHPAEPYFPLVGAIVARRDGRDPMPWLSRSLERALVNPRAHLLVADVLQSLGRTEQALFELRIALDQEPTLSGAVAAMAIRATRDFEPLVAMAEEGPAGALVLEEMASRLSTANDRDLRVRLFREAMQRDEARPAPHIAIADDLLRQLGNASPSACRDDLVSCLHDVEAHAQAVERARPDTSDAARIRARALLAQGRAGEGERLLAERCPLVSDDLPCLRTRLEIAAAAGDAELLPAASKALLSRACATTRACAEAATFAGQTAKARGDKAAALGFFLRAAKEDPSEARWLVVAQGASESGAHAQAAEALERVARLRGGADADLRRRIDELRLRTLAK